MVLRVRDSDLPENHALADLHEVNGLELSCWHWVQTSKRCCSTELQRVQNLLLKPLMRAP